MDLTAENVTIAAAVALVAFMLFKRRGDVTPRDAHALVRSGACLLDVRSASEFASGHLDGALNIPVSSIGERLAEIGPKDRSVVVYCASGARSAMAARMLKASGFAKVKNLGAMSRWEA